MWKRDEQVQINAANWDTQNKCFDNCELSRFFTPPIAKNYQYAGNWENKVKYTYSCKKYSSNWIISSCLHFIKMNLISFLKKVSEPLMYFRD